MRPLSRKAIQQVAVSAKADANEDWRGCKEQTPNEDDQWGPMKFKGRALSRLGPRVQVTRGCCARVEPPPNQKLLEKRLENLLLFMVMAWAGLAS